MLCSTFFSHHGPRISPQGFVGALSFCCQTNKKSGTPNCSAQFGTRVSQYYEYFLVGFPGEIGLLERGFGRSCVFGTTGAAECRRVLGHVRGGWDYFGETLLVLGSLVHLRCRDFSSILTYFGSWEMLKCEFCSRMRRPFGCQSIFGTNSDDIV